MIEYNDDLRPDDEICPDCLMVLVNLDGVMVHPEPNSTVFCDGVLIEDLKQTKTYTWQPDWVVSPGEILADELAELGVSPRLFSRSSGLDVATIEGIIAGKTRITLDIAERISRVFGTSAKMWMNLETMYREGLKAGKKDLSARAAPKEGE